MLGFQRMMQLLPVINRDTLYVLLQFLGLVAENSDDTKADDGKGAFINDVIHLGVGMVSQKPRDKGKYLLDREGGIH